MEAAVLQTQRRRRRRLSTFFKKLGQNWARPLVYIYQFITLRACASENQKFWLQFAKVLQIPANFFFNVRLTLRNKSSVVTNLVRRVYQPAEAPKDTQLTIFDENFRPSYLEPSRVLGTFFSITSRFYLKAEVLAHIFFFCLQFCDNGRTSYEFLKSASGHFSRIWKSVAWA